jgi:hypothetical protein
MYTLKSWIGQLQNYKETRMIFKYSVNKLDEALQELLWSKGFIFQFEKQKESIQLDILRLAINDKRFLHLKTQENNFENKKTVYRKMQTIIEKHGNFLKNQHAVNDAVFYADNQGGN